MDKLTSFQGRTEKEYRTDNLFGEIFKKYPRRTERSESTPPPLPRALYAYAMLELCLNTQIFNRITVFEIFLYFQNEFFIVDLWFLDRFTADSLTTWSVSG